MIVTQAGLKRDYERLNNLGFFSKVELNTKPGPNPKKPADLTLDWNVTEQRTGTAQIGAGYSGGLTGTGLTGTLSYSQNNINGSGNGASINLQRGARLSSATATLVDPVPRRHAEVGEVQPRRLDLLAVADELSADLRDQRRAAVGPAGHRHAGSHRSVDTDRHDPGRARAQQQPGRPASSRPARPTRPASARTSGGGSPTT